MKFVFVAIFIALAIQLAAAATTTTEASTTINNTRWCWRGNNWCNTRSQVKCKRPGRCIRTVVVVSRFRP